MPRGLCTPPGDGKSEWRLRISSGPPFGVLPEKRLSAVLSREDGFSGAFHAKKKREGRACNVFGSAVDLGVVPHQVGRGSRFFRKSEGR